VEGGAPGASWRGGESENLQTSMQRTQRDERYNLRAGEGSARASESFLVQRRRGSNDGLRPLLGGAKSAGCSGVLEIKKATGKNAAR